MTVAGALATAVAAIVLAATPAPARAAAAPSGARWGWPLPAPHVVVAGFDPPAQPWLPGQRGVVLAGTAGERVRAAGPGIVAFAGVVGGVPAVSVQHSDGLRTTYEPVRPEVRTGDRIRGGEQIGVLVRTGSECPPHACLHWGLRRAADYLDPLALLGLDGVRLLPLLGPPPPAPAAGPVTIGGPVAAGAAVTGLWASRRRGRRCRRGRRGGRVRRAPPAGGG